MGQRMNEENQEQDQKDEIAGKQEEPGQIVSEKVEKKREKKREEKPKKKRLRIQGAAWRRLDNTAKLFAAVSGEDLSSVFRISAVLKEKVDPELLQRALVRTLPEFENFRVKLRKGFFWYYFETNNRNPGVEEEQSAPCRFIDPHRGARFPFRVSYYGCRINFEVFHGLTDGLGALRFASRLTEHYLELVKKLPVMVQEREFSPLREDDYLRHYRKLPHRHYNSRPAIAIQGEFLPFDQMAVLQGTIEVSALKTECRKDSHIYISGTDLAILKDGFTPERPLRLAEQFRAGGFPEDEMKKTQALNPAVRYKLDQVDDRFVPIEAGWKYTVGDYTLEMISVPGHTPGNAMFWAKKQGIMFTGDHILFDISPNITSWLESEDSLGDYLDSLRLARKYPVRLALPGHRKTGDYAARIEALLAHHERRLAETEALLAEHPGMTAYETAGKMRWKIRAASWEEFPPSQKWFAVGECMAHLDYLRLRGRIRREMDGEVWRWFTVTAKYC